MPTLVTSLLVTIICYLLSVTFRVVGELFDHGLDSWAAILLPLSIYSGLGIGEPWGTNAGDGYPALLGEP